MCKHVLTLVLLTGFSTGHAIAAPQDSPVETIEKALKAQFVPTKMAADHVKVEKVGTILTVQKDGIGAISASGVTGATTFYPNNYKGGSMKHSLIAGKMLERLGTVRDYDKDEKVYLIKLEVKDSGIAVSVQSCGTCNPKLPDPEHTPARAVVNFQLPKGFVEAAKADELGKIIAHVFAPVVDDAAQQTTDAAPAAGTPPAPGQSQPGPAQPAPAPVAQTAPPAPMAEIPPPSPPTDAAPAPPVELAIGQTADQVKAAMGNPDKIVKVGTTKEIFLYKNLKVTLLKGKVSAIE